MLGLHVRRLVIVVAALMLRASIIDSRVTNMEFEDCWSNDGCESDRRSVAAPEGFTMKS